MRPESVCAQVNKVTQPKTKSPAKTAVKPALPTTPATNQPDLTPDTTSQAIDTIRVGASKKGGVETTINYSARDSIRFDVVSKIMYLYGDRRPAVRNPAR